jgi:prepilin peptidase CpaA
MIGMVIFVVAVGLYVALAAATDIRMHRIPNYLTVPAAVLGLAYHTLSPTGWGLLASLAGLAVGFSLLFIPWLLGGSGMGDVKLLAALGAWLGWKCLLAAFAVSTVFAAVAALAILTFNSLIGSKTKKGKHKVDLRGWTTRPASRRRTRVLPFAVPMAMSTWSILVWLVARGGW